MDTNLYHDPRNADDINAWADADCYCPTCNTMKTNLDFYSMSSGVLKRYECCTACHLKRVSTSKETRTLKKATADTPPENSKRCSHCGEVYESTLENFSPDKNAKSGLGSWCRECQREYARSKRAAKNA